FLLEGPGSGHNDLVMLCLLLAGVALCLRGRYALGILSIGLSAGVKFITGAFVPWMYLERLPRQPGRRVLLLALTGLLAAAPIALAYLPFWRGLATLGGLAQNSGHNAPSPLPILLLFLALLPWIW